MKSDTQEIVRRFAALFLEQHDRTRKLASVHLLFIDACQSGASPEALAAAAQAVREVLYSLDASYDKAQAIADEIEPR
ncbi:MAG: hypothetical protein LAO09_21620 [Acidobacteriia bacterium]|nr:hypothetical protein [Terriglobia bacterium]